jgi:hypothetical protein
MTMTRRRKLRHTAPPHLVSLGVPPLCIKHRTLVLIARRAGRYESIVLYDPRGLAAQEGGAND